MPGLSANGLTWCAGPARYGLAPDPLEVGPLLAGTDPDRARELLLDSIELRGDRPGLGAALAHARLAALAADGTARSATAPWPGRRWRPGGTGWTSRPRSPRCSPRWIENPE